MEVWGVIVAIFLGALIGLQREYTQQHINLKLFAGFRTFILITFFGAILGYLGGDFNSVWAIVGFGGIILFSLISYYLNYMKRNLPSATTEISAIISYILGVMCTTGYTQLAVIFGILLLTFLTFKERLHNLAKKMEGNEMFAVVKFALLSLVVLPFLPNKNYSPADLPGLREILYSLGISKDFLSQLSVFNFYHIWLMVVLVAGISFLGYFLTKIVGDKKGHGILGFVGGLVSSTAVTLSMCAESKGNKKIVSPYVLATLLASSIMFIRVLIEVSIVNSSLLNMVILPLGVMALTGFSLGFFFYKKKDKMQKAKKLQLRQPFAILPALKFALFFMLVMLISKIAQLSFGATGIYITSIFSGIADVDAITLSMSSLSRAGEISNLVAAVSIILATISNTIVKTGLAFFLGSRKFGIAILKVFSIILAMGIGFLLLQLIL